MYPEIPEFCAFDTRNDVILHELFDTSAQHPHFLSVAISLNYPASSGATNTLSPP